METLLILLVGAVVVAGLWSVLARRHAPPRDRVEGPLGLRSARSIVEQRAALEDEDLAQLLEVHNARRRRRGEPARTVDEIELIVAADLHARERRRASVVDERELDQLLEATNARRRARGLPERSREDVRREFGSGPAAG